MQFAQVDRIFQSFERTRVGLEIDRACQVLHGVAHIGVIIKGHVIDSFINVGIENGVNTIPDVFSSRPDHIQILQV